MGLTGPVRRRPAASKLEAVLATLHDRRIVVQDLGWARRYLWREYSFRCCSRPYAPGPEQSMKLGHPGTPPSRRSAALALHLRVQGADRFAGLAMFFRGRPTTEPGRSLSEPIGR